MVPGRRRAPRHVLVPLLRAFTFLAALACVADFAGAAVGAIAGQAVASAPAGAGEARVAGCGEVPATSISAAGWPRGCPALSCPTRLTCLTVVAEETLRAHAKVGASVALALPSVSARARLTGIHFWRQEQAGGERAPPACPASTHGPATTTPEGAAGRTHSPRLSTAGPDPGFHPSTAAATSAGRRRTPCVTCWQTPCSLCPPAPGAVSALPPKLLARKQQVPS